MLKVTCESPASLPVFTRVIMRHPATGAIWTHGLADAMTDLHPAGDHAGSRH